MFGTTRSRDEANPASKFYTFKVDFLGTGNSLDTTTFKMWQLDMM